MIKVFFDKQTKEWSKMGANIDACTQTVRMQKWMSILQDCKSSGQSNAAYCVERGISIKTFYYWQNKLRRVAAEKLTESRPLPALAEHNPIVPVCISEDRPSDIIIRKAGITIELAGNAAPAAIDFVLAALSKIC